jgi:sugar transferase (PEP-CTERM/EpsH1 system associated)
MTEGLFWSPKLATTLDHWADVLPFDGALVYCSSMMQYVSRKSLDKIPRVVDLVDVDSQKWLDYANRSPFWKHLIYKLESSRVRRLEQEISRKANAITLASDAEAMLFRDSVSGNKTVVLGISNGVDVDFFDPSCIQQWSLPNRPRTSVGVSRFHMVFVGVLDYLPNVDGLNWFINQVWCKLKELVPSATLEIVGRNPSVALRKHLEREGIRVVGSVDDVRPYLAGADLVIAPLLIARGIQNKVLEAMAMGKPVLATPQAAEGIAAESDKHFLVADSPSAWVQALMRLFNRPELQDRIGMAARKLILEEYTWPSRLDRLNDLLGIANT